MKQQYDSYKPSGIDWIPMIPSHWEMSCLGRHYQVILGKMLCPKPLDSTYTLEEYFCAGDVHFEGVNEENLKQMWFSPEEKGKYLVKNQDLLIVEGGAGAGGCALAKVSGGIKRYIQNSILIVRHHENSTSYLKYLVEYLVRSGYIDGVCNEATFAHFTKDKVCHVPYPVMPPNEQYIIASWLDEKCGEIDAAIAKVDREIELIDELKQSEISRVVTRGLNPDAPLRPSGIDWIGDIPVHWKVCRINKILDGIQDGTHATLQRVDDGHPLLSAKNVFEDGIHISENESCISILDYNEIVSNGYPKKGDIALCCVATIGRGCIYPFDYPLAFQRSVTFLRINPHFSNTFILYYLRSVSAKAQFDSYAKTSAQSGVYMGDLKRFLICLPPLSEQQAIADYLDKKCAEIDGLKAKLSKKRETLTELRQSIISEAVTGKRRVAACRDRIDRDHIICEIDCNGRDRSRPYNNGRDRS